MRLSLTVLALASLKLPFTAAQLNLTDRGCAINDTYPHGNISYSIRNATGSVTTEGFPPSAVRLDGFTAKDWTWSTGIQQAYYHVDQPIWVDTNGTDLANKSVGFQMCQIAMSGFSQSQQQKGQGDNGDCTKFLGQNCEDTKKALQEQAFLNSTYDDPCTAFIKGSFPDSCKDIYSMTQLQYGRLPSEQRNCSFGEGDPDYDVVTFLASGPLEASMINQTYDDMITRIVPLFVLGWTDHPLSGISSRWSYAQAICLTSHDVEATSRHPAGVPNSAASMGLGSSVMCVLLGSMVWTLL